MPDPERLADDRVVLDRLARGETVPRRERMARRFTSEQLERYAQHEQLRIAMATERAVGFRYTRRDGVNRSYVARPYEVKPNPRGRTVLYATEERHGAGQIHSFFRDRIAHLFAFPRRRFEPVWPVRPETA